MTRDQRKKKNFLPFSNNLLKNPLHKKQNKNPPQKKKKFVFILIGT
jgi:hypothetical protein